MQIKNHKTQLIKSPSSVKEQGAFFLVRPYPNIKQGKITKIKAIS